MATAVDEVEIVQKWEASYYHEESRKWLTGSLSVTPTTVCFSADQNCAGKEYFVRLDFSAVLSIKKALSSFLFSAIVFTVEGGRSHWFASFVNRNDTLVIIQHFWSRRLFSCEDINPDNKSDSGQSERSTKIGTMLLRTVHNSHATLGKAAADLQAQGEKLSNSACTVQAMQEDLGVAERLVAGLSSWFGRWRLPKVYRQEEIVLVNDNDIPDVLDVDALYTVYQGACSQECVLRVGKEGLSILSMKQKVLHKLKWKDVSRVRVVTPWEIFVSRFRIGQPDESYGIVSVKMPAILRKLESFAQNKMELMNPPDRERSLHVTTATRNSSGKTVESSKTKMLRNPDLKQDQLFLSTSVQDQAEQISGFEANELSKTLNQIKSMALDISLEQDSQIDRIQQITSDVEHVDMNQKMLDQKVKKLLK